jgi:ribosome-binding factor A
MTTFSRAERVGGHVQKVLTDILQKEISDPRLKMVTITQVKLTSDLRIARVYFTLTGSKVALPDAKEGFKSAHGYLKRSLARQLGLRYMPDIEFHYDDSFDHASQINEILRSIKEEDETHPASYSEQ